MDVQLRTYIWIPGTVVGALYDTVSTRLVTLLSGIVDLPTFKPDIWQRGVRYPIPGRRWLTTPRALLPQGRAPCDDQLRVIACSSVYSVPSDLPDSENLCKLPPFEAKSNSISLDVAKHTVE